MSLRVTQDAGGRPLVHLAQQPVPSGQPVDLYEVLVDEVGAEVWVRFRFLAPDIGKEGDRLAFADVETDFPYLCVEVALPYLREFSLRADVVVISLLDRPVSFGASDPDATQFIEAFRVAAGTCEWEVF